MEFQADKVRTKLYVTKWIFMDKSKPERVVEVQSFMTTYELNEDNTEFRRRQVKLPR